MRPSLKTFALIVALATSSLFPMHLFAQSSNLNAAVGSWEGNLVTPNGSLRLVFNISSNKKGHLESTIDSPDQGATGIPVTSTSFEAGTISLNVAGIGGSYEGKASADGQTFSGEWSQGGMTFPLELKRTGEPKKINRPQEPQRPFPYDEEDVLFENKGANLVLAGTLTTPRRTGPHPAVILISGSGPQDRNEALMGHKPFLVLSDYLTRKGIAVLRYDDRGTAKSTGNFSTATSQDLAEDAQAAVDFLKTHPQINPNNIGLAGHSEGGLIAPILGAKEDNVSFIVMLAGPGVPGYDILVMQNELMAKAGGMNNALIEKMLHVNSSLYKAIMESEEHNLRAAFDEKWAALKKEIGGETATALGLTAGRDQQIFQQLSSPWFRYFLSYDPIPTLKQVKVPILSLIGEKDLQVPADANTQAIKEALQSVNHPNYKAMILPGLNHLFQTAETGALAEYSQIEETFAPAALELMGNWILEQVKR